MSVYNIAWLVFVVVNVFHANTYYQPVLWVQLVQTNSHDQDEARTNDIIQSVGNAQLTLINDVTIATRDAGVVAEIAIGEGDSVKQGQVIFRLDRALYESELAATRAELLIARTESENDIDIEYAEKSIAVNRKVLERSQKAVSQFDKSVSLTEIERLDLEMQRSILVRDQARHAKVLNELTLLLKQEQLKVAELRLKYRDIKAPIDGWVVGVLIQKGEWVASGQSTARVINQKRLRVEALIDQKFTFRVKSGQHARFETDNGGAHQVVDGRIVFVSPEINPLTEEFLVWAEIDNSDFRFKPGMKGTLTIIRD